MEWLIVTMVASLIVASIVIGVWAESKGKSFYQGFFVSLFVSPLIGAIFVASMNNENQIPQALVHRRG